MNRKTLAIIVLIPLLLSTAYALMQAGIAGVVDYPVSRPWSLQVLLDLILERLDTP